VIPVTYESDFFRIDSNKRKTCFAYAFERNSAVTIFSIFSCVPLVIN